jgi:hypothetical protein
VGADHAQLGGALPAAPVLEEGGIFKEKWWRIWEPPQDPKCDIRLMSVDTAYTDKTHGDFSAVTIWGRFRDEKQQVNLILRYAGRPSWRPPTSSSSSRRWRASTSRRAS